MTLTAGLAQAEVQDEEKMRDVYRGLLVDMSNRNSGLAGMADFIVTGWTVAAERDMLINTLRDKGHDDFIKALRMREEKGYLSPQTTQTSGQGNARFRRTMATTSSSSSSWGGSSTPRPATDLREYDVSLVTMDFPAGSDTGTGEVYWAVRGSWDKDKDQG